MPNDPVVMPTTNLKPGNENRGVDGVARYVALLAAHGVRVIEILGHLYEIIVEGRQWATKTCNLCGPVSQRFGESRQCWLKSSIVEGTR